jgi:hypothetical protein
MEEISLIRACLGVNTIASEAKAFLAKIKYTASMAALQKQELPTDLLDLFDLPLSAHIVPH